MTSPSKSDRISRIEKLAGEAALLGIGVIPCPGYEPTWGEIHGSELATLLRELKTRIEAEEGGGL